MPLERISHIIVKKKKKTRSEFNTKKLWLKLLLQLNDTLWLKSSAAS